MAGQIEPCSTLKALIWAQKIIGLHSLDKNEAKSADNLGEPRIQSFCGRENR